MILVDTNILIRRALRTDPLNMTVRRSITTLRSGGDVLCIVAQNLHEFWAIATRPRPANGLGLTIAECRVEILRIRRVF